MLHKHSYMHYATSRKIAGSIPDDEIETSSIDWAQLSSFDPKTEVESSIRNVVLKNKQDGVFR
jgi:hypothetical protein